MTLNSGHWRVRYILLSWATGYLQKVWPAKRCQSFPITLLPFIYYAVVDLHGELGTLNKHRIFTWSVSAEFANLGTSFDFWQKDKSRKVFKTILLFLALSQRWGHVLLRKGEFRHLSNLNREETTLCCKSCAESKFNIKWQIKTISLKVRLSFIVVLQYFS